MERKRILLGVFLVAVALLLAGAVGLTLAQGHGRVVKVEEVTIFYQTSNSASYIDTTHVTRQKATLYTYYTLVNDTIDRTSTAWTAYSVTPTADNTLSASEGFVSVILTLHIADITHSITIGGVRIQLGHHRLY